MYILPEDRPALMGILNVTPDSFSDGGLYFEKNAAIDAALQMVADGADLIDVGGESTRPGADEVSADEEIRRVVPVIEALEEAGVEVSIDTRKPEVALQALYAGASVLNDVSGLRDPAMLEVAASDDCTVCIMHMQGEPQNMQVEPAYEDVVGQIRQYLVETAKRAEKRGIHRERLWIDPGIGFGKTLEHNMEILRNLEVFRRTGYPVLIGVSRKSFIGKLLADDGKPLSADDRLEGTLAAQLLSQLQGVRIIRAHDVKAARRTIDFTAAFLAG
jgi:dihydropteroate synthase